MKFRKMILMNLFMNQGRNRDVDEGEVGMNCESSTDIYK